MPIQLQLTNGTPLNLIQDRTIDSSQTSLTLIGIGWLNPADFYNQNMLYMLENFAGAGQPNHPLIGQLWYDANRQGIRVQVGIGGPDANTNGWTSPLTTTNYVNQSINNAVTNINETIGNINNTVVSQGYVTSGQALNFTNASSDLLPAYGTISAPPNLVLKNVNSNIGTFSNFVVNAKGLITSARNLNSTDLTSTGLVISVSGDMTGNASLGNVIPITLNNTGVSSGTFNTVVVNSKGLVVSGTNASYATGNESISITGDATGSGSTSINLVLKTVNSNVGNYSVLTVNAKGLVTAARALNSTDITTALGYTPYNSSNPSNYATIPYVDEFLPLTGGTISGALAFQDLNPGTIYRETAAWMELQNGTFNIGSASAGYTYTYLSLSIDGIIGLNVDGNITYSGTLSPTPSDERLKSNIVTYENALSTINKLRGVSYTKNSSGKTKVGLIAQEVLEVVPEVVEMNSLSKMYGIHYDHLVGILINALNELSEKNHLLEERVGALEYHKIIVQIEAPNPSSEKT